MLLFECSNATKAPAVKLETRCTVIDSPTVSVLCLGPSMESILIRILQQSSVFLFQAFSVHSSLRDAQGGRSVSWS